MGFMKVPRTSLMKYISSRNKAVSGSVKRELSELNLKLLDVGWMPERMERHYLENLENAINLGVGEDKLQEYFNGYVSMRGVFQNFNNDYGGYHTLGSKGKGVGKSFPLHKLHTKSSDEEYKRLENLALEKGYNLKINSENFQ